MPTFTSDIFTLLGVIVLSLVALWKLMSGAQNKLVERYADLTRESSDKFATLLKEDTKSRLALTEALTGWKEELGHLGEKVDESRTDWARRFDNHEKKLVEHDGRIGHLEEVCRED